MQRRFDGIIFDMGDILYDASAWRRWLTDRLGDYGVNVTFYELVDRWERHLEDVYRGKAEYWSRFRQLLEELAVEPEKQTELELEARDVAARVGPDRNPTDKAAETLAAHKEGGVRLAVLSDNESGEEGVRAVLDQLRLEQYFDAVVSSADIGMVKPDPDAFLTAVAALGLQVNRCAFVGHDVDELVGAQNCGLVAIAFNEDPRAPYDLRAQDFDDLVSITVEYAE